MMASTSTQLESATSSDHTKTIVASFGPAGTRLDIRESGANILDIFCNSFPDTERHSLLPQFFGDNITELMEPEDNLTRRQERQFRGRAINQVGEGHELFVFNLFVQLIRQSNLPDTLLLMRTFEMDAKNHMSLKRNALLSVFPNLDFKSFNTEAENDFLILIKNAGVVLIEAKGSTNINNVRSAEKQLHNVNGIVQCIMKAMTRDEKRIIPTVKLIMIPDCTEHTPKDPTQQGSYFVYKDLCNKFGEKWENVISKLHQIKTANPFTAEEFKYLSQILVGIWSAKAVSVTQPDGQTFELEQEAVNVSYTKQLEKIDEAVNTGNIRNEDQFKFLEDKLNPWTKIVRTDESDIFRSCTGLKLCYLTPSQKELFSFQKQTICRGPAGCGKSLLILFKTLELLCSSSFNDRIIILAPKPHNIRFRNAICLNNYSVDMIEQFPPPPSSKNIFIMELNKFFKVDRDTLMQYDMSGYHMFIDDLQFFNARKSGFETHKLFQDVGDFIDQAYGICVNGDCYLWVMLDEVQGTGMDSQALFVTADEEPITHDIPVVELCHIMRSTYNIVQLNNETRMKYVNVIIYPRSQLNLPFPKVGHKVTSRTPTYHKLQKGADEKYIAPFVTARLREELEAITKPPFSLQLGNVAIIYDYTISDEVEDKVTSLLINEFGTTPQTIEEQLTRNNTKDIVIDYINEITSFEAPIVVYIDSDTHLEWDFYYYYMIATRARVSFTIIDVATSYPPITLTNIDDVHWKPDSSGNFSKC